jgi:hypothetical protein
MSRNNRFDMHATRNKFRQCEPIMFYNQIFLGKEMDEKSIRPAREETMKSMFQTQPSPPEIHFSSPEVEKSYRDRNLNLLSNPIST